MASQRTFNVTVLCLWLLIVLLCFINVINGHVSLTFPPARKYDLDFLDNSRTKGPCGMPKGKRRSFISLSIFFV